MRFVEVEFRAGGKRYAYGYDGDVRPNIPEDRLRNVLRVLPRPEAEAP